MHRFVRKMKEFPSDSMRHACQLEVGGERQRVRMLETKRCKELGEVGDRTYKQNA